MPYSRVKEQKKVRGNVGGLKGLSVERSINYNQKVVVILGSSKRKGGKSQGWTPGTETTEGARGLLFSSFVIRGKQCLNKDLGTV